MTVNTQRFIVTLTIIVLTFALLAYQQVPLSEVPAPIAGVWGIVLTWWFGAATQAASNGRRSND